MTDLHGKIALITGAGSGIGEATARRLADDGATVVVADFDVVNGQRVADEIGGSFVRTNVAIEAEVEAAVVDTVRRHGRIDVYFGNAGISGPSGPITDFDAAGLDRVLDVNFKGVAYGMKYAARAMKAQGGGGSIISTASVSALQGGLGPHLYSATKAAVLGLTRSVALELAPWDIRVNAVAAGGIVTNLFSNAAGATGEAAAAITSAVEKQLAGGQPLRRAGRPEDIAAAVAYLASAESSFVTGQTLVVDGGLVGTYGGALEVPADAPAR